jgi:hypothetical protein
MRGTGHARVDFSGSPPSYIRSFLFLCMLRSVKLSQPAGRYLSTHSREERSRSRDEDTVQCMRGGRGESAVLRGRGSVMLGMRPPDPRRQQVSQQAPQSPSRFLIVNAQVRYLPGTN